MTFIDVPRLVAKFGTQRLERMIEAVEAERDLSAFFKMAWSSFDPSSYVHNWHVDAVADHLMAVTDGHIRQLLINIPPRTSKSNLVSVAWPAWTWAQQSVGPLSGPQVRFLCLSYAGSLALEIASTARRLLGSDWYRERWGERVRIDPKQDNKEHYATLKGGARISIGFGGGTPGRGGAIRIIDDPHKVDDVEGDITREAVITTYDEALSTRDNDPLTAAEVTVMQRLHSNDLSGHILEKFPGVVHLCLPMEYDPSRHCHTVFGSAEFDDPRGLDDDGNLLPGLIRPGEVAPRSPLANTEGALLWPTRFTDEVVQRLRRQLGPYAYAGQMQQLPVPRGGGIVRAEWWRLWPSDVYPDFLSVIVSVDTAHTEKEQNDESAISVWGIFEGSEDVPGFIGQPGQPLIMLVNAWEGRLEFKRLLDKIAELCRKYSADVCLVEGKANGLDIISEIRRTYGKREWTTVQIDPKGDKVARLTSIQAMFSGDYHTDPQTGRSSWIGGVVYAPDKDFATLAIERTAAFPKVRKKGLVDTVSQAMRYMRDNNMVISSDEHLDEIEEEMTFHPTAKPAYDV